MNLGKRGRRKSSIIKKLMLSLSFPKNKAKSSLVSLSKSKSWHCTVSEAETRSSRSKKTREDSSAAPNGCFAVYVGPEKQRFVIKAKCANHPLFKMLLEDAEMEYGYNSEGPLLLPCDVDIFYRVLAEIDNNSDEEEEEKMHHGLGCGSLSPFNHARRLRNNTSNSMGKGYTQYGLLTPPRLLKINHS